jgi:hypothetical protein
MFELRPLSVSAIPAALAKAERYRLLNEASEAESICLDILAVDADHQEALVTMILAITDQFRDDSVAAHAARAEQMLPRLHDEYARAYYTALIHERRARAYSSQGRSALAYDWTVEALHGFERALALRPSGNDDAILRWNACVRLLRRLPQPAGADHLEPAITSE